MLFLFRFLSKFMAAWPCEQGRLFSPLFVFLCVPIWCISFSQTLRVPVAVLGRLVAILALAKLVLHPATFHFHWHPSVCCFILLVIPFCSYYAKIAFLSTAFSAMNPLAS
jgi:hypothetical protein